MKALELYIKESLLDDLDDLESKSDKNVKDHTLVGCKMYIQSIDCDGMNLSDLFGLRNMKKLKIPIIQDKFEVITHTPRYNITNSTKNPDPLSTLVANYILNLEISELLENTEYGTGYIDADNFKKEIMKAMSPKAGRMPSIHIYRSTNMGRTYFMFEISFISKRSIITINFRQKDRRI